MYMCPYSIPERIYAHLGFSIGNYCMGTWGALVRRIWTMPWCVKNIFLSNHPCMCWRKRFGINFNIFKRCFIFFYFGYCWLFMQFDSAFSHSESVGWRYVISASALYYAFWSKTTKQIILYSIIVELIVIFFQQYLGISSSFMTCDNSFPKC